MNFVLQPWQLLVAGLAGWVNRKQQAVIDFQGAQIQVLMERLGRKRLLLSDDQRRRLAVKAKVLGRKALLEITTIFTPDTLLRWHRKLVAKKWDHSHCRRSVGRVWPKDSAEFVLSRIPNEQQVPWAGGLVAVETSGRRPTGLEFLDACKVGGGYHRPA